MKIMQVGPNSPHVEGYLSELQHKEPNLFLIAEGMNSYLPNDRTFVLDFKQFSPIGLFQAYKKVIALFAEIQPDVIHIHQVNRAAYFACKAAKKMKIRVVLTAWGSDVLIMPKKNFVYRYMVQYCLKNAQFVTADSMHMIEEIKHLEPNAEKYVHVQYGITPIKSRQKEKIIYSNRLLQPLYRIEKIIEYFYEFQLVHSDWTLVIGATGSEEGSLKSKVNELKLDNKVEFVGWLKPEQNREWYSKATVYISIPSSDGTSVSVLEAMSAGCIPIVPSLAVSREWIQDGQNGIIEKANNNPLFEAIQLDREICAELNTTLIEKKATRIASIHTFQALYGKKN